MAETEDRETRPLELDEEIEDAAAGHPGGSAIVDPSHLVPTNGIRLPISIHRAMRNGTFREQEDEIANSPAPPTHPEDITKVPPAEHEKQVELRGVSIWKPGKKQ